MGQKVSYTEEFKASAIKLVNDSGKPASMIAKELGISPGLLYGWLNKSRQPKEVKAIMERISSLESENKQLKAELKRIRQEREILKKATAYFARESE